MDFKVRDFRNKGFFLLDDTYLNGYARYFDTATTAVYLSLCRHADKGQKSFPAQELLAQEHNINPRTVRRKLKKLEEANIIKFERTRGSRGKWLHNTYFLLDKSEWKTVDKLPMGHGSPVDNHRTRESKTTGHGSPLRKDTHLKETHIISHRDKPDGESSFKEKGLTQLFGNRGGASYPWQDHAARMAKSLGIEKPTKNWFSLFKKAYAIKRGYLLDETYTAVADVPKQDPEKYFFKVFWVKLQSKNGSLKAGQ